MSTEHVRNEGPGGCVPWERYVLLEMAVRGAITKLKAPSLPRSGGWSARPDVAAELDAVLSQLDRVVPDA